MIRTVKLILVLPAAQNLTFDEQPERERSEDNEDGPDD